MTLTFVVGCHRNLSHLELFDLIILKRTKYMFHEVNSVKLSLILLLASIDIQSHPKNGIFLYI